MYALRRFLCIFFEADQLSSARAPTSGGQYHWVAMLAPPSCRNFLSYITGTRRIASYTIVRWPNSPHIRMAHCRRLASSRRIRGIPLRNSDPSINYIKPPIIWLSGMACNINLLGGFGRGCPSKYGRQQRATEDRRIDLDLAYLGILCCFNPFGVYVSVKGNRQGCVHCLPEPGWMELSRTFVFHRAHGLGFFVSWYFLPAPKPEHCVSLVWLTYKSKAATASFMCVTKPINEHLFSSFNVLTDVTPPPNRCRKKFKTLLWTYHGQWWRESPWMVFLVSACSSPSSFVSGTSMPPFIRRRDIPSLRYSGKQWGLWAGRLPWPLLLLL